MAAIRYSGDVEVRMRYDPRKREYNVTVRGPRKKHTYRAAFRRFSLFSDPASSAAYDSVARAALKEALRELGALPVERSGSRLVIRRVFQSACPVPR